MLEPLGLTTDRSKALHRQIRDQIAALIRSGRLAHGTRLPSTREMAKSLGVARLTVITAYENLHADGFVDGDVGRGTYVTWLERGAFR